MSMTTTMTTRRKNTNGPPPAQGLYHPAQEHDACGIGFVANVRGHKSHEIISKGIQVLLNLTHRGACGCDPETGDGAGILIQIPHQFFAARVPQVGFRVAYAERLWRGHDIPARGEARAPAMRRDSGTHHCRRGINGIGLARYALLCFGYWPRGARFATLHPTDLCRVRDSYRRRRFRAETLRGAQARRKRDGFVRHSRMRRSSTSLRSRAARLFTKVCCWPRRSQISTKSFPIPT